MKKFMAYLSKLLFKQIIVTIIFSIVLTSLHLSKNPTLSSCAESLGRAMRHSADFDVHLKDGIDFIKEKSPAVIFK